ncbi:GNAT family N-acetyltransferase [Natribacillus halophilus]|uniref:Protein N-acetyltransferase, RimJ/RimL family n=1 Tax=Natribacillus halophilus TaxID=549003 RepID=A0A1G8S9F3_9BACI|nr:GNAT family protein [Natribacillus halophilus]SDJ25839.1 Protein N-acetyltransferase, RimJ/RimL family [Natribacillus halophilus]
MAEVETTTFNTKNNQTYTIRTALPEDAEKLLTYNQTIIKEARFLLTTPEEFLINTEQQKASLEKLLSDPNNLALIAECNNHIIGFLDYHNGHKARVQHQGSFGMSVLPAYRAQGIGRALVHTLLDWGQNHPLIEKINLEVLAGNAPAIRLYSNLGFIEEARQRKAIKFDQQNYDDLIAMAYFLQP